MRSALTLEDATDKRNRYAKPLSDLGLRQPFCAKPAYGGATVFCPVRIEPNNLIGWLGRVEIGFPQDFLYLFFSELRIVHGCYLENDSSESSALMLRKEQRRIILCAMTVYERGI